MGRLLSRNRYVWSSDNINLVLIRIQIGRAGRDGSVSTRSFLPYKKKLLTNGCRPQNVCCITVSAFAYPENFVQVTWDSAREDVVRVKNLVSISQNRRQITADMGGGPPPSQRSVDSFTEVCFQFIPFFLLISCCIR